jgi:hypothetical protein
MEKATVLLLFRERSPAVLSQACIGPRQDRRTGQDVGKKDGVQLLTAAELLLPANGLF